jgi:hypothetical protein
VNREIRLTVSVEVQPAQLNWTRDWLLEDSSVDRFISIGREARQRDV